MGTSAFDLSTLKPVSTPPSGGASAFDLSTLKPIQTAPTQTPQRAAAPAPPAAPSFGQRLSAGWQGLEAGGLKGAETGFETGNAPVAPQSKPAQPVSGAALKAPAPPAPRPTTPYRPQATVSAAPTASLWDRARESVANSAVGAAVQSTMPKVAQALGLEPTESEASPTYQQNRQSMPQLPAWTQKPILPAIERGVTAINRAADPRSYTAAGRAVRAQEETQRAQQNAAYDAAHPYQAAVAQAGREFAEGMTTPTNLAQLALVPAAKPLMALYALQGANGTYDSIEQAWEAHMAGKNPEAVKLAAEAGLSGIVTAMAGRAALKGAFPVDTARPTVTPPRVEIPTEQPLLTAGTPTTIERIVPQNRGGGGGAGGGGETVPRNVPRGTVEQPLLTAGETKPILHDKTASAADLTESAQKLKPILGDAVLAATKGVPGANLEAVRAKDLDRTVDKTDRQNVQPSQIGDISGAKVTVPDQQAADQVLQNLDRQMPVESVNGQVTGEPGKNGVRQVQAIVKLPETGEPVKRAEVLIQTPEMNLAADQTHDDYRKAQELRRAGKDAEAQKLEDKIMRQHDEAERAAQQRLEASNAVPERGPAGVVQRPSQEVGGGRGERERVESVQQRKEVAPTGTQADGEKGQVEPRYKFGNTQANIPESSPAALALNQFRTQIPENHLAGDGRDVGAGGNHVTVRYGVKGDDTDEIQHYIEGQRPFTARLGQTDVFPPTEHSNGAAVVHAKIEAPELARINSEIEKHGDFEPSSFKDYKPHATIAYIDPAQAEAYRGRKDLVGKEFPVNSITISDRNGNQREVQLLGAGGDEQTQLGNRPAVGGHDGKPTELIVSPTNKMPATYRLVEASDLVPSHNAQSFEPNPAYPTGVQERAPAPPTGRTAVEPSTGGGSAGAARPTDLAPRAPAPTTDTKSPFTDGRQKTAIELQDADGNWKPATLDYYNGGVNGQPRRGRVTLANGSKDNDVSDSRMRLATQEAPAPAKALESSDETVHPIGPPIEGDIANLVRDRISRGLPVKIFTRRISREPREANRQAVDAAIREQFGVSLPITDVKTAGDGAIYDDSSNVEHNTGRILSHTTNPGDEGKPILVDLDGTLRKSIPSGVTSPGVPPGGEAITERGIEGEKGTSTAGQPSGAVPTEVGRQPQRGGAVEPVAAREANPAPTRTAEEPRAAEAVRRESAAAEPEWSGTRGAHMQERLLAKGKFDRELSRAKASAKPENILRAQVKPIQLHGVQAMQLNADAFHFLSERMSPGVDWPGVFLDRRSASKWVAGLRAEESDLRQKRMSGPADAAKKLALALDGAREPDGSIILLREDYNDSTIREELAHRWQTKTGLRGSYAQTEVSQRPEFEEVNQRLRDIGYDLSPEDQATELIAKALAGDPAMKWTPEQQNAVVSAALHAAIDEMGADVLDDMAPYDPAVKTSVEEAKQYGKESDTRAGGEAVREGIQAPDSGTREVGRERGSDLSEEPGNRPAGPGGQRGISEGRAAEGELGAFQRAPKPPASRALPGMERDIEAQRDAAAEEQGRQLTERLRAPRPPISRAAGIMERESPLFRDTDAGGQGSLFQRALASKKEITEKPEFKSWFGDSKAVDEDGSPKIVFHGTAKSFDVFDPNLTGARTIVDTGDFGKAAYFADSPEVAGGYATSSKLSQPSEYVGPQGTVEDLQKIVNRAISDPNVKAREGDAARSVMRFMNDDVSFKDAMARAGDADLASKFGGSLRPVGEFNENIMPVYLKAENPLVLKNAEDFRKLREFAKVSNEDEWFNLSPTEQAKAIQDKGYDSVHDVSYGQWAVFDPRQVKSAIGNRGTFDPSNPSILFQRKEGKGSADKDDAARMARDGLPLKEERPKPRETTATTGNHDIDKGIDETIDELGKLPKRKMSASEHMDQAVDAATKGVTEKTEAVKGAFAGVKGAAAGAWSTWCTPPAWSDYRQSLSDLRSAEFKAARQVDIYQKALVKVAPSERERNAITIYGEAESAAQLKHWQMAARAIPNISKEAVRAFDDALKLTPEQKSVAEAHRDYYNQQLKILTDAGLLPTGASNYTMHMFASDPETLSRLNSVTNLNELSPNPSFLNKRVYPSFFEAIKNGEKPTTLDAGKILSAYHDAFTKTFMTRSFIRSLIYGNAKDGRPLAILESRAGTTVLDKKGTSGARILKQPKRPEDMSDYVRDPAGQMKNFTWELTDEDREMLAPGYSQMPKDEQSKLFGPDDPRFPVPAGKVLALRGDILLHPEVAKQVHDLVTKSWFKTKPGKTWGAMTGPERVEEGARLGLNAIGIAGATAKGVILYGSGFHQVQLGVHSMEHLVNPFKLPSMDEQANNAIVLEGVAHGLNLLNIDTTGVLSTLPGMGTYHRYLFRDYIPRLKAEMYKHAFARNMERFGGAKDGKAATMTRDEIHLLTAQQANAAFGGLDPAFFEQLNRMNNKTYQAIEHLLLFSPDFTKARIQFAAQGLGEIPRLAARVASKPFKSTQTPPPLHTEQLAALLRGALVMYGICRITNAVINRDQGAKGAHWDWQDALVVVTPKSWGVLGDKHIGLRMVQGDMLELIKNPVTWAYNRLNPATLRPAIEFLTGRDNFGRQESKMNFAKNYLKQMAPIQVQKLFTTSDEGWVDSLFTSAGLQLGNYRSPLEQEAHKLRLSDIPDRPGTEEKMDEARANVQEVKKLRDAGAIGENPSAWPEPAQKMVDDIRDKVANGKMSSRAASTIIRRAGMTEFQYDVSHLSMDDAMSIWNKAGAGERAELKDVITEKASRSLEATAKDKGIDAMNELEARLKDKGIMVGPQ